MRSRYLSSSSMSFGTAVTSSEPSGTMAGKTFSPTNRISETYKERRIMDKVDVRMNSGWQIRKN